MLNFSALTMLNPIRPLFIGLLVAGSLVPIPGIAQFNPDEEIDTDINPAEVIHWRAGAATLYTNGILELGLQLFTEQNFTLYTDKVSFIPAAGSTLENMQAPEPIQQYDPISGKEVPVYTGGDFQLRYKVPQGFDSKSFALRIKFLGCTTKICLFPYTQSLDIPVTKSSEALKIAASQPAADCEQEDAASLVDQVRTGSLSIVFLLLIALLGGLATNLTPCVAPMVPITIRVLSHQQSNALTSSALYAAGIMITYSSLGLVAAWGGLAFGSYMQNAYLNIAFAVIMGLLGMTMLGFGNLAFLQNIGMKIGSGKQSSFNTFLMGTGAGLVAAPCTGPILGALLTYTTTSGASVQESALLMVTYSFGFALPYVFLGVLANRMTSMRVSAGVQVVSKTLFAAVMFGLAFYYLRVPLYAQLKYIDTGWGHLAGYGLLGGSALTMIFLQQASLSRNKAAMLVPTIVLGFGVFAASQWLSSSTAKVDWVKSTDQALARAQSSGKPILMDNWAEWCEACKKMDRTTFIDPQVVQELEEHWVPLKVDLTEENEASENHMETYRLNAGLPTLIMLPPSGKLDSSDRIVAYIDGPELLKRLHRFRRCRAL